MNASLFNNFGYGLVVAYLVFAVSACNTTKATLDTFAKFTSSTSPESFFNADGLVQDSQKANLFTAVVYENLQQDIARGNGEYLTSLGILLNIPADRQDEFRTLSQSRYTVLFDSTRPALNTTLLETLTREFAATPNRNEPSRH
jgi:Protein of unknown function (DUF3015)